MNRGRLAFILLLSSLFVLLSTSIRAEAADISWTNAAGGDWNTAENWNSGAGPVPGASDNAIITLAGTYTVTLDVSPTVASLTLGGTSDVQTLSSTNHTITLNATSTIGANGLLLLINGTVAGSGTLSNQGTVESRRSSDIDAPFTNSGSGSLLRVEGNSGGGAVATFANGFTNNGTIELTSVGGAFDATLNVTAGTLVNEAGANIDVLAGTGGSRTLGAQLDNRGTLTVNTPLTLSKASADHLNSGTIDLTNEGLALTQSGTTPTFTNTGLITIGSAKSFAATGGLVTNASGGTIQGAGTLNVAASTFSNAGNINPGTSPGILSITGACPLTPTSALNFEIGGATAGTARDSLAVSGAATLDGAINATLINGFTSSAGDSFVVMGVGSRTGQFATENLPALGGGLKFHVLYRTDSVVLKATLPTLAINNVTVAEGNSGTVNAVFAVTLSEQSSQTVTVDYATANDVAAAPADYATTSGTLTFPPGTTSLPITVPVSGDVLDEADETFFVNLSNPTIATIDAGQGTGTITDDDPTPSLSINDVTVTEGDAGTVDAAFTVTLSTVSGRTVTVHYATATNTAASPGDFAAGSGTLTFPPGTTTQPVTVAVNGDELDEADETFFVNLTAPGNAAIADNQGQGTISDDDPTPSISINEVTETEGDAGTVNAVFAVTLSAASGRTVTVDYATADNSALSPGDYASGSGTLTFPPGTTTQPVTVTVNGDVLDEPGETFFVNLTNPTNATIADNQGQGTITDDDPAPSISINDVTMTEGNSGTVDAAFTVTLSAASGRTVTVDYDTADNTALNPGDYASGSGTLTFAPGITSQPVTVTVNGDAVNEPNETFFVNLTNPTNATVADNQGQGTITDDDGTPILSINSVTVTEGNAGTVNAVFAVTLSAASGQAVTVNYATGNNTAVAPGDFAGGSGTLTFPAGTTTQPVTVVVNGDALDEADETFFVDLTTPSNATIADNQGQGTITDDDPPPSLSVDDVTVTEGNSGTVNAIFAVTLSAASGRTVTVDYDTADNTALNLGDYASSSGTLTFPPGTTSQAVTVVVNGDALDEADETFFVNLSNAANAVIPGGQGTGSITDDDPTPSISINDVTVTEGNSGTVDAVFAVTLSAASGRTVTVAYATANNTALTQGDYASGSGTLTFAPGTTSQPVTVTVNGDAVNEPNETFFVNLTNPTNATIADNQGQGTITNDDGTPTLSINSVTVTEGNAGTVNAVFAVGLTPASGQTVTVDYDTADNTAGSPADFAAGSGTLTFTAGQTSLPLTVAVSGDLLDEPDETFFVNLTNATNASISGGQGTGTITDDDPTPSLSINDVTVTEGNAGTVNAVFAVTLSAASGRTVTVNYATANNTALTPGDYASGSGTLTFPAGTTSQPVTVAVNGDVLDEPGETFFVNLTTPGNATIADNQGQGTITDDDSPPSISINDVTVTEGNSGTVNAVFAVTLSAASGRTVTVNYATANNTALTPGDYASGSGTLTFPAGTTSQPVTVAVSGDVVNEANETYFVNLTNPTNATIADNQGQGTITNDDGAPALSINSVTVTEGNAGTVNAVFAVTLSAASGQTVTVNYATANNTALTPGDYASGSGTLTFAPGVTSRPVTVVVSGDALDEAEETFFVNLTAPGNATIADNQGQGTITDDDPTPSLSISNVTVNEGNAGTVNAVFAVTLSAAGGRTVTVNYATANNTALTPGDYASGSGTLTFTPGITSQPVTVVVNSDVLDEPGETFFVNLTTPGNATIADNQGQGTITDDDSPPSISINDVTVTEGNSGTVNAVFAVTLSAASGRTVTVAYATADNTALSPGDYASSSGTLTFPPGTTSQPATVTVNGDAVNEPNETFFVNLTNPTNATIADNQGQGTITNDEGVSALSINSVTVTEGNAGTVNAVFAVSLIPASGQTVTVNYATANNTAGSPADFATGSGTLTFTPGQTSLPVTVAVSGDLLDEPDETFFVNLTNATNASISGGQGTGTITDDDPTPSLSINDVTVTEGNAGTVNAVFAVTLSAASGRTVTVDYDTADNTALSPGDYASGSGTLTFAPGITSQPVTVTVNGDAVNEPNETFYVNLTIPTNATVADNQGQGIITDDDPTPSISINDVTVTEGNSGTVDAVFAVTLSAASGRTVTVAYATANNTALTPGDYASGSGTLTFAPGTTSQPVTVTVNGDALDEANETFFVNLTTPGNATIADNQGQGTITDDDTPPSISIDDVTVTEGNAGTVNAVFAVTLSAASGRTVTVNYATADNTALSPGDYASGSGTLTFPAGTTSQPVTVAVSGDVVNEANETYFVNLTNPTNATIADNQGQGTITNDDGAPALSINSVTVTEGNSGTVNAVFAVTLSEQSSQTITVDWATANEVEIGDGVATTPADYAAASGTLTFPPFTTSQPVTVAVNGDVLDEANERFFVILSNPTNALIAGAQGVVTITDDDPTPSLSINDVTVVEGDAGTANANFTVTLSAVSGRAVSVHYAATDVSALSPYDYAATSGTLTFPAGTTTQPVTVAVNGDLLDEPDETFYVNLTTPVNATISDNLGQGTITDDDATPSLSIDDVTATEGNAGTVNAVLTVTLSAASGRTVTVDFATANNTALTPGDYLTNSATLTFTPGQTSQPVTVQVNGDLLDEPDETFFVNLTAPANATIGDNQGQVTITDDDPPSSLSVNDVTVTEGDAGTVNAVFTVTLIPASGKAVTVDYATADGTAAYPGDYASGSGTLTFPAGTTSQTVAVTVNGDVVNEPSETFYVDLTNPTNSTISDNQGTGTIANDDGASALSINNVSVIEGDAGTVNAVFTVSLLPASSQTVTVDYATANNNATYPGDYAAGSGTLTFTPGQTSQPVTIAVNGDLVDEADETFYVNLTNATNAPISGSQGTGTITDDDPLPSISINDLTGSEGGAGTTIFTFTLSLSAASGRNVTVDYATANGTATEPEDYTAKSGTLGFAPGETSKQIIVLVVGDLVDELNETFFMNLTNPTNATIADAQGQATIVDDETPTVSINDITVTEGNSGTVDAVFSVTLSAVSAKTVTVNFTTEDGTATTPNDYPLTLGTITFSPGTTSRRITIPVIGDTVDEGIETFFVILTNSTNSTISDAQGDCTISNDDAVVSNPVQKRDDWNEHPELIAQYLPLPMGGLTVTTTEQATLLLKFGAGPDWNYRLRAEFLATLLNVASEAPNAACVQPTVTAVQNFLTTYGSMRLTMENQPALADQAHDFMLECRAYNEGHAPCGSGSAVTLSGEAAPAKMLSLGANYPNPFHGGTEIEYSLGRTAHARLVVYDVRGREVKVLVDESQAPGDHSAAWDGTNASAAPVASGIYFYRLTVAQATEVGRMILAR